MSEPETVAGGSPAEPPAAGSGDTSSGPMASAEGHVDSPTEPVEHVPVSEPVEHVDPPGGEPSEPTGESLGSSGSAPESEVEIVDGFPVLAEVRTVERVSPASLPAVQAAAAAGAGFVAGAATVALVKRRAARRAVRNGRGGSRRPADLLPIAATRSFLVDVHVIAKPE